MVSTMEILPLFQLQKALAMPIAIAKESTTQAAMTEAPSLCVQLHLLIQQVQGVVFMRKIQVSLQYFVYNLDNNINKMKS